MSDLGVDVLEIDMQESFNLHLLGKNTFALNFSMFFKKDLNKALMHGTKFCNTLLNKETAETRFAYKKQSYRCLSILHKSEISFFENLDIKTLVKIESFRAA